MNIAARLDDIPKPAWIALMVVGFIVFWPIGLGILAYLFWSGRMSCSRHHGRWHDERGNDRKERFRDAAQRWWHGGGREAPSSGNRAFDEYREDTLRRLEGEQREFRDYLDRLRHAKDKAEFDQFVADRRRPGPSPSDGPPPRDAPPSAGEPAR